MNQHVGNGVDEEITGAGVIGGRRVAHHVLGATREGGVDARLLLHGHGSGAALRGGHQLLALLPWAAGQGGVHVVHEAHVVDVLAEVGAPAGSSAWCYKGVAARVQAVNGAITCKTGVGAQFCNVFVR